MSEESECHFCRIPKDRIITEGEKCVVIRDLYPVTDLHTLIIPKRHASTYFDLTSVERREIEGHLLAQRALIEQEDLYVTGFNIGMNCGRDAGQTVMHCHVHLIPRRKGDMDDPRGGVRGVIPAKQTY